MTRKRFLILAVIIGIIHVGLVLFLLVGICSGRGDEAGEFLLE